MKYFILIGILLCTSLNSMEADFQKIFQTLDSVHQFLVSPNNQKKVQLTNMKLFWEEQVNLHGKFIEYHDISLLDDKSSSVIPLLLSVQFKKSLETYLITFDSNGNYEKITGLSEKKKTLLENISRKTQYSSSETVFTHTTETFYLGEKFNKLPFTLSLPDEQFNSPLIILIPDPFLEDSRKSFCSSEMNRLLIKGFQKFRKLILTLPEINNLIKENSMEIEELISQIILREIEVVEKQQKIQYKLEKIFLVFQGKSGYFASKICSTLQKLNITGAVFMGVPSETLPEYLLRVKMMENKIRPNPTTQRIHDFEDFKLKISNSLSLNEKNFVNPANLPLQLSSEFWIEYAQYQPAQDFKNLKIPVLILQGKRDFETRIEDFTDWMKNTCMIRGSNYIIYPGLNHFFQKSTGLTECYYDYYLSDKIPYFVFKDIAEWMGSI